MLEVFSSSQDSCSLSVTPSGLALTKMRAAANETLVQRTLHSPRIPRKPVAGGGSARSSSTGSSQASSSGASHPAQKQSSTSSPAGQSGKKGKNRKGKAPFSSSSGGFGCSRGKGKEVNLTGRLPLRVGGCLAPHWRQWQAIGAESWVVTVLRDGYRVPILRLPSSPFSRPGIVSDVPGRFSSGSSLGARGRGDACQRSLRNRPRSGSWLLQSSLPGGEGIWRPVIDLSHLKEFVHLTRFKMETVASVLLSVREGNFLASLDLKDAYFQIPIHVSSRKLLRFTLEGADYQF